MSDFAQTPPVPLQPYTEYNLWASNPGDETAWPKSAKLYNAMATKFGPQNILAPPDWVTNDEGRVQWLKRDQNAMLYFMFKKNDYKNEIQKQVDAGIFNCFSSDFKAGDADQFSPFPTCCTECCTCGSLCWLTSGNIAAIIAGSPQAAEKYDQACCFPACTGGPKLRKKLFKRLNKVGINTPEEESCIVMCFCLPCIAAHTHGLVSYINQKRYGVTLVEVTNGANTLEPERKLREKWSKDKSWPKYLKQCKKNKAHPYSHLKVESKTKVQDNDGNTQTIKSKLHFRRERLDINKGSGTKLLAEWIKPAKAVQEHNDKWKSIHFVQGPINMD